MRSDLNAWDAQWDLFSLARPEYQHLPAVHDLWCFSFISNSTISDKPSKVKPSLCGAQLLARTMQTPTATLLLSSMFCHLTNFSIFSSPELQFLLLLVLHLPVWGKIVFTGKKVDNCGLHFVNFSFCKDHNTALSAVHCLKIVAASIFPMFICCWYESKSRSSYFVMGKSRCFIIFPV